MNCIPVVEEADPLTNMSWVAASGALSRDNSETSILSDSSRGLQEFQKDNEQNICEVRGRRYDNSRHKTVDACKFLPSRHRMIHILVDIIFYLNNVIVL